MVQIYGRSAMADRLYDCPRWCLELLGLTGKPSVLSEIPSGRSLGDQPIVGREKALEWLLDDRRGDSLVIGVPGSGKTLLLSHLVKSEKGLFLIDNDRTALADAIREQRPKAIIVDDAQFLYREVLKQETLREWHLIPLHHLSEAWKEKALVAIEFGYLPAQIAEACYWMEELSGGWVGDLESDQHGSFVHELAQEEGPLGAIGREAQKLMKG